MDIPHETGGLTAIARDPHTIFVYWTPGAFGADKLTGKPGANVRAIIGWRLRLQSADCQVKREIEIDPAAGSYYFHELIPGLSYEINLALVDTMTELHTVGRCRPVDLPAKVFSSESSDQWPVSIAQLTSMLGEEGRRYTGSSGNTPRKET